MNIGAHRIFSITLTCAQARPVSKLHGKLLLSKLYARLLPATVLCCTVEPLLTIPLPQQQGVEHAPIRVRAGVLCLTAVYVSAGICALLLVPTAVRL